MVVIMQTNTALSKTELSMLVQETVAVVCGVDNSNATTSAVTIRSAVEIFKSDRRSIWFVINEDITRLQQTQNFQVNVKVIVEKSVEKFDGFSNLLCLIIRFSRKNTHLATPGNVTLKSKKLVWMA
jgi:hypothetical protein